MSPLRSLTVVATLLGWSSLANACEWCAATGCGVCPAATDSASSGGSSSGGFTLSGRQWPQPGGDGTPITLTYSYNNFLDGGLKDPAGVPVPADYLRLVTEEAFGLWASVAPLHFVEVPDVGTPVFNGNTAAYNRYPLDSFGQIRLNHRFINGTDAQNGMPTTKALAYFPDSANSRIAGDIHFDNGDPWAVVGTPSEPDVLGILVHEIGHAIGIDHSTIDGAVMFPAALRRMGPGTGILTPDDTAAVRAIYGAGVGSVTTLVPEPSAVVLALLAIGRLMPQRRKVLRSVADDAPLAACG